MWSMQSYEKIITKKYKNMPACIDKHTQYVNTLITNSMLTYKTLGDTKLENKVRIYNMQ